MSQTSNSTRSTSFHSAQQSRSYGALSDAFSKAWEQLSNKEKGLFSPKSGASAPAGATAAAGIGITDIWSQIESKQEEFSKSKKQIFLRRLQPYIDGLNRYSQTINVFTQAKPELLALIWVWQSPFIRKGYPLTMKGPRSPTSSGTLLDQILKLQIIHEA